MGRYGTPDREISFVSLVAYSPKVSESALTMGVTASEVRQGYSQQISFLKSPKIFFMYLGDPMLGAYIFTMFLSSW